MILQKFPSFFFCVCGYKNPHKTFPTIIFKPEPQCVNLTRLMCLVQFQISEKVFSSGNSFTIYPIRLPGHHLFSGIIKLPLEQDQGHNLPVTLTHTLSRSQKHTDKNSVAAAAALPCLHQGRWGRLEKVRMGNSATESDQLQRREFMGTARRVSNW